MEAGACAGTGQRCVCMCREQRGGTWPAGCSCCVSPTNPASPATVLVRLCLLRCRLAKQQLRILIFPGTEVLWKHFKEVPPPQGHHILVPPPDKPSAEEAADAMEVAAITANMVACVAAACGEPVLPEALGMTAHEVAEVRQGGGGAPLPAAQPLHMAVPQPAAAGRPAQQADAQQQRQQQQLVVRQQQQQPGTPPPDEYESMLAAALRAVDRPVQVPQAGAGPPPWGAAAMQVDDAAHPQSAASDSDVSISDADEDDNLDDVGSP